MKNLLLIGISLLFGTSTVISQSVVKKSKSFEMGTALMSGKSQSAIDMELGVAFRLKDIDNLYLYPCAKFLIGSPHIEIGSEDGTVGAFLDLDARYYYYQNGFSSFFVSGGLGLSKWVNNDNESAKMHGGVGTEISTAWECFPWESDMLSLIVELGYMYLPGKLNTEGNYYSGPKFNNEKHNFGGFFLSARIAF